MSVPRASVRAWLQVRQPSPPADLASKLADSVGSAPESVFAGGSLPAVLGALGTWLLGTALRRHDGASEAEPDVGRLHANTADAPPAGTRPDSDVAALDLLAADAFVTYAFEAASEEGTAVTGLANQLLTMVRP